MVDETEFDSGKELPLNQCNKRRYNGMDMFTRRFNPGSLDYERLGPGGRTELLPDISELSLK